MLVRTPGRAILTSIASTKPSIDAAQRATSAIPTVMILGVDPIGDGLIGS